MRRARGSRVAARPRQISYPARFDPGEFNVIAAYADAHDMSFNKALRTLIRLADKFSSEYAPGAVHETEAA
jgi:hypothetical protein